MLENQLFLYRYENQLTSDVQYPSFTLIPLETSQGLKLVNPLTKEYIFILFEQEQLCFDWSQFLKNQNKGGQDITSVDVIMEDGSKLILKGYQNLLSQIYRYTVGKYIFKRGNEYTVLKNLLEDHLCQIRIVFNQNNGQQYLEKVILSEANQEQEEFSMSNITQGDFSMLPEEIQIIFDLHRISTPHLLSIDSIFYDNAHYSNNIILQQHSIRQKVPTHSNSKENVEFIACFGRQIYCFSKYSSLNITYKGINNNQTINPETHDIILINYNQAFYCNKIQYVRKGAIFGYAPPEYFQVQTQVTTKANIFQVGVLLFYLYNQFTFFSYIFKIITINQVIWSLSLWQRLIRNNVKYSQRKARSYTTPQRKEFILQFYRIIIVSNLNLTLLEKAQQKRPKAEEALKHSIFLPMSLQKLSNKSINSQFSNQSQVASTEEFQNFNQISNVQIVRSRRAIIRKH